MDDHFYICLRSTLLFLGSYIVEYSIEDRIKGRRMLAIGNRSDRELVYSYGNRRPPERTLYGEKVENPSTKYGLSNKFTDHLAAAKMYR